MYYIPVFTMRTRFVLVLSCILYFVVNGYSQQTLPLIRVASKILSVRDGDVLRPSVWKLSPQVAPDIYYMLEPLREKTITFYTDKDSISFQIKPGESRDFLIVLNEKDTCLTRIMAIATPAQAPVFPSVVNVFTRGQLREDLLLLRHSLEEKHPGLYRYRTRYQMNHLFDSCYTDLKDSMTNLEFGQIIMYLISALQDGHTGSTVPRFIGSQLGLNSSLLPIYVYFIGQRAYTACSAVKNIPSGIEILAIDGKPVSAIQADMYRYLPSDGCIETKKRTILNEGNFGMLYRWLYGDKKYFSITCRSKNGNITKVVVPAKPVTDGIPCKLNEAPKPKHLLDMSISSDTIAIMTIHTFDENRLAQAGYQFSGFLKSAFKKINESGCCRLIIDLRGNGGGLDEYGALLFSCLVDKPFRYFKAKYSTTDTLVVENTPLLGLSQPATEPFKGRLLILTDGRTFSAASDFCARVRSEGRGKFVGEETGGGYYGNTSSGVYHLILPNTKFTVSIPLYRYDAHVKPEKFHDRGVIPDVQVTNTINDIISRRDLPLLTALEWARK